MNNIPPNDPIAQLVAKYQSNGHQTATTPTPIQSVSQPQKKKDHWGFTDKTVWEWLNLLGVLLVPLVIGLGTIGVTWQQSVLSQAQHDNDQKIAAANRQKDIQIADDQQKATILKTYMDGITDLLVNRHLRTSKPNDEVSVAARDETLIALQQLDGSRRGSLILFLYEAKLIVGNNPVISLETANLSSAVLQVTISPDDDPKAASEYAYSYGISLDDINLNHVNLVGANLPAQLERASLEGSNLEGDKLYNTDLIGADLSGADLAGADLSGANLTGANLTQTDLRGADLSGANLLLNWTVTGGQLASTTSLKDTILPNGTKFPSKSWPIPGRDEHCVYLTANECN